MSNRNAAYYRWQRYRTIEKKKNLLKCLGGDEYLHAWIGGDYGRLAKGKIHCSCPMCRRKSYDEPSHRDKRQAEAAVQHLLDCPFVKNPNMVHAILHII